MFTIPFTDFITLFQKPKNYLEDSIDNFSSWIGSSFMLIFCTIATVGLGFGNHFECMIPKNYNEDWQRFMFSYCYVQPHFYVDSSDGILLPEIHYFPWLPYFFFGHAIAFYLPKIFWKAFSGACGIDLECILNEAKLISKSDSCQDSIKKEKISALSTYMTSTLGFSYGGFASKYFLFSSTALLFLFKKFLYVIVACSQLYVICCYIGQGNLYWGFEVLLHSLQQKAYLPSKFFPLFSFCRVPVAEDGMYIKKTVYCILGMNVVYEKLYVFAYFMLLGIIFTSFFSAVYYVILFITPLRTNFIEKLLASNQSVIFRQHVEVFTHDFLGADGFLSILLIKQNFGDEVAKDVLKELWSHTSPFSYSFKKMLNPKPKCPLSSTQKRYAPIPNDDEY
uniref:Innexin n=1 Tax=Panagrolaimus sp. ES5 TaxID=591445 RepID=A0AC34FJE6_9BILA